MKKNEKISKKKKLDSTDMVLICMASFGILFLIIFNFIPMFGTLLAFKDGDKKTDIINTILFGKWVGFDNFIRVFSDRNFLPALKNTLGINLLSLLFNFPASIIFALLINEVKIKFAKKTYQTISIFPHFISWTIFGGIILAMTDPTTGLFNRIFDIFNITDANGLPVNLQSADYFWATMIIVSILKGVGWGSVIYIAAISAIPIDLYEAAEIDGAGRFQRIWYVTLPMISTTISVFLLLNISKILTNSFDQFYAFQNVINLKKSEVLSTFIYKKGLSQRRYSFAAATGLFDSLISIILLVSCNLASKKLTGKGIF